MENLALKIDTNKFFRYQKQFSISFLKIIILIIIMLILILDILIYIKLLHINSRIGKKITFEYENLQKSNLSFKEFKLYKNLCPKTINGKHKILVGKYGDGSYALFDDFNNIRIAYSFGISNKSSFDEDLANRGINVYMYDHTINKIYSNDTRLHWQKVGITSEKNVKHNLKSLRKLLKENGHINEKNMILKMDIEHNEWEVLDEISPEVLNKFKYLILEFHFRKPENYKLYANVLEKLNRNHQPFHIHCSNCGTSFFQIGDNPICRGLEVSFIIKKGNQFINDLSDYPIKGFDFLTCPYKPFIKNELNILKFCNYNN